MTPSVRPQYRYAECYIFIVMLIAVLLSDIARHILIVMLIVVMLSVIALSVTEPAEEIQFDSDSGKRKLLHLNNSIQSFSKVEDAFSGKRCSVVVTLPLHDSDIRGSTPSPHI